MTDRKICNRCLLTEDTPGIVFDNSGVCNYCTTYETKLNVLGEGQLVEVLTVHKEKNKGKKFDCMIGVSGGRDSTYTLYKLVKEYGMRVLCIHYDNPFTSEQARKNMQRAAEILNVNIVKWGFKEGEHLNATKRALKVWSRHPSSSLISIVCAHCKNWWPTIFKHARKNDISLIVIGSNPLETASFKKEGFGGVRTYHKVANVPNLVRKTIKELVLNPGYLTLSWRLILSMYLGASHSSPYLKRVYKDINVIRLFDYVKWNEKEVESTIIEKLDWKKSSEVESPWRFDCRLDYVRRKMYASTVGVTELRDLFSKMIREGMITRNEAETRLKKEDYVSNDVAEDVLKMVDMKLDELNIKVS
jgi:hypothetical protein